MNLKEISQKRQKKWKDTDLYKVKEDISKPKFYILDMFPYPSGSALHVGHPKGYIATDALSRKKMLEGFNVLHPMGFDTFGLGTEQHAIEHKMKPQDIAKQNIDTFISQLEKFGTTYDRSRTVNTADPKYFKRTQRVFLQMYNHYYDEKLDKAMPIASLKLKIESGKLKIPEGLTIQQFLNSQRLAYVDYKPINRCPKCMTGLANEDLDDGKCERCGSEVEQKPMKQRVLRITKYADRLLSGLDDLQREESMKDLERNWIGKSEGTQFEMQIYPTPTPSPLHEEGILPKLDIGGHMIELARKLRKNATNAEQFLWEILRGKSIGYKFRRQHPIANYIADFYCPEAKLVIELDGGIHDTKEQKERDLHRDEIMKQYGFEIMRFKNQEIFEDTDNVLHKISSQLSLLCGAERGAEGGVRGGTEPLKFSVYTTRIDTVFGMSFVAIAPEHPLLKKIENGKLKIENWDKIHAYQEQAKHKTQLERTELQKDKSGVKIEGIMAINPFNGQSVPIFVADYVLANYGTGVVMAVPAHDERDFEFAKKYDLPITCSISPNIGKVKIRTATKEFSEQNIKEREAECGKEFDSYISDILAGRECYIYKGSLIDSGDFTGLNSDEAIPAMQKRLQEKGIGGVKVNYRMQDRVFSRQRYRGEPFPVLRTENKPKLEINFYEQKTWEAIIDGIKTLETRAINPEEPERYFGDIKVGDTIKYNNKKTEENILVKVTKIYTWASFDELWNEDKTVIEKIYSDKEKFKELKTANDLKNHRSFLDGYVEKIEKNGMIGREFEIITPEKQIIALEEKDLPLELPDVENYEPTGTEEGPLANITDWVNVTLPDGTTAKRETNTMPGRAGSSRYWLRYMDVNNENELVGKDKEKYRGSVDVYVGGAEHITRHMIYGRFWQKFLFDIGTITHEEPFQEYHSVGLIMGEDGRKMSKRRGNVVNPDSIINEFGTDVLRAYEMFMGPFDQSIAWSTNGIKGIKKFLDKVIALKDKISDAEETNETKIILNQSIKKLTEDIDGFRFNTAISQLMILVNHLTECATITKKTFEDLVILISPFAPHLAEELREQLGNEYSIFTKATWPEYDEKCLVADTITIAVQVNGKVRGTLCISKEAEENEVMDLAKEDEKITSRITGEPKKVIYVKGKILNIVV